MAYFLYGDNFMRFTQSLRKNRQFQEVYKKGVSRALAAASIVLLLAGLIRAFRKKRAGIMILVSLIGIIGCIAWFIFLVSSKLI